MWKAAVTQGVVGQNHSVGPTPGYFPNARKTKILVKPHRIDDVRRLFEGTGIEIVSDGARILGSAVGSTSFINAHVNAKIEEWTKELEALTEIGKVEPQAALACLTRTDEQIQLHSSHHAQHTGTACTTSQSYRKGLHKRNHGQGSGRSFTSASLTSRT